MKGAVKLKRTVGIVGVILCVLCLFGTAGAAYAEVTPGYTEIYSMDFDALPSKDFGNESADVAELQREYPYTRLVSSTSNWGFSIETDSQNASNKYIYVSTTEAATSGAGGKIAFVMNPPGGFVNTQRYRVSYDVKWDAVSQNGPFISTKGFHYVSTLNNDEFGPWLGTMQAMDKDSETEGFQAVMYGSYSISTSKYEQTDNPLNISEENRVILSDGEWHKVEMIIDCYNSGNKRIDYYYDGIYSGSQTEENNTFPSYAVFGNNSMKISVFQGYHANNGAYLDNIKIEKAIPGIAKLVFVSESGEKTNMSPSVETISKKIEVSMLNITDVTALMNSVNLSDENGKVLYTANYDEQSEILTIDADDYFAVDKKYMLSILGEDYSFEISPTYLISDMSLKKGDTAADSGTPVLPGDILSANVGIIKNIQEEKKFIFGAACYDGNNMKSLIFKNFTAGAEETAAADNFEFTVPGGTNIIVKMFVIDDFVNNNLLRQPITIGNNSDTEKFFTASERNSILADKAVAILVFAPGKSTSDLAEQADMIDVLAYYNLINADSDGFYSADIRLTGDNASGEYSAVSVRNGETVQTAETKRHISSKDNKAAVEALINAETKEKFIDTAKQKADALGFGTLAETVSDEAFEILYNFYRENTVIPSELEKNTETAKKCERLAMFNADTSEDNVLAESSDFTVIFKDDFSDISEFLINSYFTEDLKKAITTGIKGTKSLSEIRNTVNEQFILNVVKDSNGYENLTPVLKKFANELGVSDKNRISNDMAKKVSGKEYESIKALADDIKKLSNNNSSNGTTGLGGSGGSGGTSGKGGGGIVSGGITSGTAAKTTEIPQNLYTDVSDEHWARDAIVDLTVRGIMSGNGDGTFNPDNTVTREQFTKMVVLAFCENTNTDVEFTDVAKSDWFYGFIATAYNEGLITGINESEFGSGLNISRQDMAVILARAAEKYNYNFKAPEITEEFSDDFDISDYAREAVYTLKYAGVLKGSGDGFAPKAFATRAEAAMIIYNMISM